MRASLVLIVNRLKIQEGEMLLLTHAIPHMTWPQSSTPSFGHASLEAVCKWFATYTIRESWY